MEIRTIRNGDLIFSQLSDRNLGTAIEGTTQSQFQVSHLPFSHVAIYVDGSVLEARGSVRFTEWQTFLQESSIESKFAVGRLRCQVDWDDVMRRGHEAVGEHYDACYAHKDSGYTCASLVYHCFGSEAGPFQMRPMDFEVHVESRQFWYDYFARQKQTVPQGVLGISPVGIAVNELVEMVWNPWQSK